MRPAGLLNWFSALVTSERLLVIGVVGPVRAGSLLVVNHTRAVSVRMSGNQSLGLFGRFTDGSAFVEPPAGDPDDGQLGQRAGEEAAAGAFVEQVV